MLHGKLVPERVILKRDDYRSFSVLYYWLAADDVLFVLPISWRFPDMTRVYFGFIEERS